MPSALSTHIERDPLPHGPLLTFLDINMWNSFSARILVCRVPDNKSFPVPDESGFIKSTVNFNQ